MRRVSVDSLVPGMRVGHNIYNSRGETLISHDVVLNKRYIDSLKRLGIPALYIIDESLPDFYIEDVITEKSRVEAIKLVRNILQGQHSAESRLDNALMNGSRETISDIIEQLLDNPGLMVNMIDIRSTDDYLFGHSVNVCVLSLITGISLGYDRGSLMNLGLGSLMHDMGKVLIPGYILNKPGPLSDDEYNMIKKHSEYGYSILTNNDSYIKKLSALIALQHHERYNGEGYPKGLLGADIHEFSQIVGIADVFDAMTADRVYRKAYPPYEAFEMLAGSGDFFFDYKLVLAFLSNIAAYPVGTIVWLSSKEIAIVVETPKGFPLYPRVKVIYDTAGNKIPEPVDIDLSTQNEITVLKVIEYEKLEEIKVKQGKLIS